MVSIIHQPIHKECFMRPLLVFSLAAAIALPATAQYPQATINAGSTPPAASAETANNPGDAHQKPKTEVGYDAKVKRDPYGKIINDGKSPGAKTKAAPPLRNDQKLRGDSEMFKR